MSTKYKILNQKIKVLNIGLEQFAYDLKNQGIECVQMDWKPQSEEDILAKDLLAQLLK